ncbi:MAG: ankyrin repeat domain-containing protein [Candidatus Babeliales bacterium]|nr:ankyrin repeat domain-containing protein [Candidatus Babeliales bacterium]
MKLSQAILISLTLVICFSQTISLAMEQVVINIKDNAAQRDALVLRLKNKNFYLFKSLYDVEYKNYNSLKKTFKYLKRIMCCCCPGGTIVLYGISLLIFVIQVLPFIIAYLLLDSSGAKNLMKILAIFCGVIDGLFLLTAFFSCMCGITCDELSEINDANFLECISNNDINIIRNNLENIYKFKDFNANKYLSTAIICQMPYDIIETLFNEGGKFNIQYFGEVIKKSSFEMVKFLVDLGIDVNAKDVDGTPAIIIAFLYKKLKVIDLLLAKGVDVGVEDRDGKIVCDYLNALPEIRNIQEMKHKFIQFRRKLAEQIYYALEELKFPQVHADLIAEYLV